MSIHPMAAAEDAPRGNDSIISGWLTKHYRERYAILAPFLKITANYWQHDLTHDAPVLGIIIAPNSPQSFHSVRKPLRGPDSAWRAEEADALVRGAVETVLERHSALQPESLTLPDPDGQTLQLHHQARQLLVIHEDGTVDGDPAVATVWLLSRILNVLEGIDRRLESIEQARP